MIAAGRNEEHAAHSTRPVATGNHSCARAWAVPSEGRRSAVTVSLRDYIHTTWTHYDGVPLGSVDRILQTSDGYLWIFTRDDLLRFDGMRFVRDHRHPDAAHPGANARRRRRLLGGMRRETDPAYGRRAVRGGVAVAVASCLNTACLPIARGGCGFSAQRFATWSQMAPAVACSKSTHAPVFHRGPGFRGHDLGDGRARPLSPLRRSRRVRPGA